MYKSVKNSGGTVYLDVPAWGNALDFLRGELGLPIVRAADTVIERTAMYAVHVDPLIVYFEDAGGNEIAYWTSGRSLFLFDTIRHVHESMQNKRTLWEEEVQVILTDGNKDVGEPVLMTRTKMEEANEVAEAATGGWSVWRIV